MEPPLPYPSSYDGTNEWAWFSAKLGLRQSEVFALHERFNTRQIRLQDPWAFHRDVAELANESDTLDAFYTQLAARRDLRLAEMDEAWLEVKGLLAGTLGEPRAWGPAPSTTCASCSQSRQDETVVDTAETRWFAFVRFTRTMSCDSLLLFFDEFARGERKRREREEEERREVLERLFPLPTQTQMPTTPPSDGATIHDCHSETRPPPPLPTDLPSPELSPAETPTLPKMKQGKKRGRQDDNETSARKRRTRSGGGEKDTCLMAEDQQQQATDPAAGWTAPSRQLRRSGRVAGGQRRHGQDGQHGHTSPSTTQFPSTSRSAYTPTSPSTSAGTGQEPRQDGYAPDDTAAGC
ncbi:hypothetical protein NKR19_g10085 [Coniochaeta hoffmannii]|uniref:Uncharacterized protein n=1 Tax=Coniochaeta hoffmannii TaxID=91930 RepID=A0AA38R9B7_9PEZI|nr:hypothetical protein NKR19_g10085 [Coniochaeta hoffmannii]